MFGFQGGESADTVARKKSYMKGHYKEFRYTNLDDAIAQATRQNGSAKSSTPKQLSGS
jgi:hypothetical protein